MAVLRARIFCAILLAAFSLAPFAIPSCARKTETGFLDRVVTVSGASYKYQVFVPEDWTSKKRWPVILYLHGAGERGADGLIQTQIGIATAIRKDRSRFPAIVVMPQCRKDQSWSVSPMDDVAMAALRAAQREFNADPVRTYLTGISMGGYGVWHLAAKYPETFAAIVPIAGGILTPDEARRQPESNRAPYLEAARKLGHLPVWIFHGSDDTSVPVTESRRIFQALKSQGGDVHYTEFPGVGHNAWDLAYSDPQLTAWLFSKSVAKSLKN